jgi:hypothetical protein
MTLHSQLAVASMVVLFGAACGSGSGEVGTTAEPESTGDTEAAVTTGAETTGAATAVTTGDGSTGDESTGGDDTGPEVPAAYEKWLKVEVPGTVCGDGSQYKFFVNYKEGAKDLVVMLEPGGACWDYAGCSGQVRPRRGEPRRHPGQPSEPGGPAGEHLAADPPRPGRPDRRLEHGVPALLHRRRAHRQQRDHLQGPGGRRLRTSSSTTPGTPTSSAPARGWLNQFPASSTACSSPAAARAGPAR